MKWRVLLITVLTFFTIMPINNSIAASGFITNDAALWTTTDTNTSSSGTSSPVNTSLKSNATKSVGPSTGLSSQTLTQPSSQSMGSQSYQSARHGYDELDRLKWTQYEEGTVISYDYDKVGNRTAKSTYSSGMTNFTITVTSDSFGSVIPSGTINVPAGSNQTFIFVPAPGSSLQHLFRDDVYVGKPASYTISNITANHTLMASFLFPDGDLDLDGSVTNADTTIALNIANGATPLTPSYLIHGDVAPLMSDGISNPNGVIDSYDVIGITRVIAGLLTLQSNPLPPCTGYPARLAGAFPVYYRSLSAAYGGAVDGGTIQGNIDNHMESLLLDRNVSVTLDGGYLCDFSLISGNVTIKGDITISNGTLIVKGNVVVTGL